jgi:GxxExxY protein
MTIDNDWLIAEPEILYTIEKKFPLEKETFEVIGVCMEIHRILGKGFSEIVYKDALEYECKTRMIPYQRERKYEVNYKGIILPHCFFADFVLHEKIILEIKSQNDLANENVSQVLNYLSVSKCPVALLLNFGERSLKFKRFVL